MNINVKNKRLKKTGIRYKPSVFVSLQQVFSGISAALSISKLLVVLGAMLILALIASVNQGVEELNSVPVRDVVIEGDINRVSKESLQVVIHNATKKGFYSVDLKGLHRDIINLPWIKEARVKRVFPNSLLIEIEENELFAFWNEHAVITKDKQVVYKDEAAYGELPHLIGDELDKVLDVYTVIDENIPESMKPVRKIDVSYTGVVRLKLAQDIDIVMDTDLLKEQLARWVSVFEDQLINQVDRLRSVDLRYVNGLAAVFENQVNDNNNKIVKGGPR